LFYTNIERAGNNILTRGYDDQGKLFFHKDEDFKPRVYIPANSVNAKYKSLKGQALEAVQAGSLSETKEFIDRYKNVDNFEVFGQENWISNYIVDKYPGKIDYNYDLINLAFFDIETTCEEGFPNVETANEEILIISFWNRGTYYIFSTERYGKFVTDKPNIVSETFPTEELMLHAVVDFWSKMAFDIVSGWYSDFFDIPYVVNRINRILGKDKTKKLSPWGMIRDLTIPTLKGDQKSYTIVGVNHIDYMAAYKKFSGVQLENMKLDTVGNHELGLKKLDYSEFESMRELYQKDFQKFCEYNLRDNEILVGVEKKRNIIKMIVSLALNAKVNMVDTFKQTVMWDNIFYNHLLEKNIIVPRKEKHANSAPIPGGFVREVNPGMFKWIVSLDLDSLYPHLIMGTNISPETYKGIFQVDIEDLAKGKDIDLLRYCKKENYALAGNGAMFDRSIRGFIPELMDVMYKERKQFKSEMLKTRDYLETNRANLSKEEIKKLEDEISRLDMFQNVRKIQLNSAYGSLAQIGFRFFQYELACAITLTGQTTLKWAVRKLNEFMNKILSTKDVDYVLAADTDSIHLNFEPIVKQYQSKKPDATREDITNFIDKIVQNKFQPFLDAIYEELAEYLNSYEQKMKMKRENIVDVGVYLAKKKYIYNVLDSEGTRYADPKLKVMGLELVKSNTPAFCRKKMKEACKIVLEKSESDLIKFIEETKKEFMKLPFEDIAYPQGVNHISKYTDASGDYVKGTQIYARGSIIYNNLLKKKGLTKKYETIGDGDKIKYCYLKMPNPIFENIISVPFALPKELGLHEYVDYETQFEKTFMSAIGRICAAVNWQLTKVDSLEDFFN
jgi:DNA polymerase elongation subunit (family B)